MFILHLCYIESVHSSKYINFFGLSGHLNYFLLPGGSRQLANEILKHKTFNVKQNKGKRKSAGAGAGAV